MKNRPVYRGIYNMTFPGFALLWVELFWALFTQSHHHKVYVHFQAKKERLYFASFCFLTFISTKTNCSKVSIRPVTFENWKAQLVKELLSLDFEIPAILLLLLETKAYLISKYCIHYSNYVFQKNVFYLITLFQNYPFLTPLVEI